jgi:DNA-binding transcriptional regulator YdaS (Cro superfamily)
MTKQSAIEHYGTAAALAQALGVSRAAVSQWISVPLLRQYQIQVLTNGTLKADTAG